jgi:hypothetical protein
MPHGLPNDLKVRPNLSDVLICVESRTLTWRCCLLGPRRPQGEELSDERYAACGMQHDAADHTAPLLSRCF